MQDKAMMVEDFGHLDWGDDWRDGVSTYLLVKH
jgi:hypothetical protein